MGTPTNKLIFAKNLQHEKTSFLCEFESMKSC